MKQKLKRFFRLVSLLCCGVTLLFWIVAMCGFGFAAQVVKTKKNGYGFSGFGSGIILFAIEGGIGGHGFAEILGVKILFIPDLHDEPASLRRPLSLPTFNVPEVSSNNTSAFLIPYWLLLIAFGAAPAMHIWGRIKEKRDKKLFEQSVASKRAEIADAKSKGTPPESSQH